jgi:hypothetical protein
MLWEAEAEALEEQLTNMVAQVHPQQETLQVAVAVETDLMCNLHRQATQVTVAVAAKY